MKSLLPLTALVLFATGCSTAYKAGQTPDDVYFSKGKPHDEYVQQNKQDSYRYDEQSDDDRYLRMKVHNRRTWSDLDYYYSDPYAYNYYNRFNNYNTFSYNTPWNYYASWNYFYNPYAGNIYNYNNYGLGYNYGYGGGYNRKLVRLNYQRPPLNNHPRQYNLNTYAPQNGRSTNGRASNINSRNTRYNARTYNTNSRGNPADNGNSGSSLRRVFGGNSNNQTQQANTPSRNERPSSNTNTSSGSRSAPRNAPVRKF